MDRSTPFTVNTLMGSEWVVGGSLGPPFQLATPAMRPASPPPLIIDSEFPEQMRQTRIARTPSPVTNSSSSSYPPLKFSFIASRPEYDSRTRRVDSFKLFNERSDFLWLKTAKQWEKRHGTVFPRLDSKHFRRHVKQAALHLRRRPADEYDWTDWTDEDLEWLNMWRPNNEEWTTTKFKAHLREKGFQRRIQAWVETGKYHREPWEFWEKISLPRKFRCPDGNEVITSGLRREVSVARTPNPAPSRRSAASTAPKFYGLCEEGGSWRGASASGSESCGSSVASIKDALQPEQRATPVVGPPSSPEVLQRWSYPASPEVPCNELLASMKLWNTKTRGHSLAKTTRMPSFKTPIEDTSVSFQASPMAPEPSESTAGRLSFSSSSSSSSSADSLIDFLHAVGCEQTKAKEPTRCKQGPSSSHRFMAGNGSKLPSDVITPGIDTKTQMIRWFSGLVDDNPAANASRVPSVGHGENGAKAAGPEQLRTTKETPKGTQDEVERRGYHVQDDTSEQDIPLIGKQTPLTDIIKYLTEHGCEDLTPNLDIHAFPHYPAYHGGFSDVYRGCLKPGTPVAVKALRISAESIQNPKHWKRAARELHTWSNCQHPNVLRLLGLALFRGRIGMVSPWMECGTVPRYVNDTVVADRCNLCTQICNGLTYLHDIGIIHGDLKGANVLVLHDGTPVLADFGNAILLGRGLQFTETTQQPSWTVRWAAPELLGESDEQTEATDTILEVITGKTPYDGKTDLMVVALVSQRKLPERPEEYIPTNSPDGNKLWKLLKQCWEYDPHKRPSAANVTITMESITPQGLKPKNTV